MGRRKRGKDVPLPQLEVSAPPSGTVKQGGCGSVRPSKRGRWRALSLILVHVAFALHIAHWWVKGKTITPVEPSEAMQTLGTEALVNAGFVLFAITILSTLVFGRFFCGWGCHVIAYQDLCTWILKKLGIKPQPFRSRLLVFAPLGAALFMFVGPVVYRLASGAPRAAYSTHFSTYDFWDRFPGWFVGSLTIFVCGFAIVYLLGNKGFCTYACPYGGFFGLADPVAPGKIRVTDACEQCGHCTAACSSNVRVHEEVHTYGMVVNPGCMKCLDCISVCPKDALYFGFGKPSVSKTARHPVKAHRYDFTWSEEIALAVFFLFSVVVLCKLYDGVPLLLALALAAISAYVLLSAARLFYKSQLRFSRFQLRTGGRLTGAGRVFAACTVVWILFLSHSAVVQALTVRGRSALRSARAAQSVLDEGSGGVVRARLNRSIADLETADRLGLVPVANVLFDLSLAYASRGEADRAKATLERAIAFAPRFSAGRYELAQLLMREGDQESAVAELREVVRVSPEFPKAHSDLANQLIGLGRSAEAVEMLEQLVRQRPDVVAFQLTLGLSLAHHGALDRAIGVLGETVERWPEHPDAHFYLGATLVERGESEAGLRSFQEAARLNPSSGMIHFRIAQLALREGRASLADQHLLAARDLEPFNTDYVRTWVASVYRRDALQQEIRSAERESPRSRSARFRLIYLYGAAGREADARRVAAEFVPAGSP